MHYSSPFRLYLITDPETGRRYQRQGRKKGKAMAKENAGRTQRPKDSNNSPRPQANREEQRVELGKFMGSSTGSQSCVGSNSMSVGW